MYDGMSRKQLDAALKFHARVALIDRSERKSSQHAELLMVLWVINLG